MNSNEVAANDVGEYERGEYIKEDEDEREKYIKEDEEDRGEYLKEDEDERSEYLKEDEDERGRDEDERGEDVREDERVQEEDEGARKFMQKDYVVLKKNCIICKSCHASYLSSNILLVTVIGRRAL